MFSYILDFVASIHTVILCRLHRIFCGLAIDTIAVENEVADNMYERSELDYLIYNDPLGYADLILNGDPETYLKTVTEYKPLDS